MYGEVQSRWREAWVLTDQRGEVDATPGAQNVIEKALEPHTHSSLGPAQPGYL